MCESDTLAPIRQTYAAYPAIGPVLPAMGYGPETVRELEQTINAACRDSGGAEFVIVGTPIDLGRFLRLDRPALRARYSVEEVGRPTLAEVLRERLLGDLRLAGRPRRDG